jgi:hypothetical protein
MAIGVDGFNFLDKFGVRREALKHFGAGQRLGHAAASPVILGLHRV